jgi:hypothetical protein
MRVPIAAADAASGTYPGTAASKPVVHTGRVTSYRDDEDLERSESRVLEPVTAVRRRVTLD